MNIRNRLSWIIISFGQNRNIGSIVRIFAYTYLSGYLKSTQIDNNIQGNPIQTNRVRLRGDTGMWIPLVVNTVGSGFKNVYLRCTVSIISMFLSIVPDPQIKWYSTCTGHVVEMHYQLDMTSKRFQRPLTHILCFLGHWACSSEFVYQPKAGQKIVGAKSVPIMYSKSRIQDRSKHLIKNFFAENIELMRFVWSLMTNKFVINF